MKNKVVFVDRDGTINVDGPYLADPDKFEMYQGVGEGIKKLKENGFKIIIITNQSGIARGYFTEKDLAKIHDKMKKEFLKFNVKLDDIYYCPHHPDDDCNCRKPKTELFERAIKEHNIDVKKSYMLGDKIQDVEAGKKIGVKTILIPVSNANEEEMHQNNTAIHTLDYIATDFSKAVNWILNIEHSNDLMGKGPEMLTIIIPTMNRSDFLIRLLKYYADTGYKHWILIGDSSNAEHVKKTKNAIKGFKDKLKIIYQECPDLNDAECVQQLIKMISTPYTVFIADDDFLVPNGLEQSIAFLENRQDYIAAHGTAILFNLQSSGPHGQIENLSNYKLPSIGEDTASQRILNHLSNYSPTLFCVHRTECWKAMYKKDNSIMDKSFGSELLPCCLSAIQGKVKQLDCFYLVRQGHDRRYFLPDTDEWTSSPNWETSYKIFKDHLAEELARQDNVTLDEAKNVIEHAFKLYLDKRIHNDEIIRNRYKHIKKAFGCFPGMKNILNKVNRIKQNITRKKLLAKLLDPSLSHHADFMPVYRTVTNQP